MCVCVCACVRACVRVVPVTGGWSVMVGRETCDGVPLWEVEEVVEGWDGRGEEEGGRKGDTTGVVLYIGKFDWLSFLLALSCGVFERTGVIAGRPLGRREG